MTLLPESGPVFHWFLPTRGDSDTPGVIPAFGDTGDTAGAASRRLPTLDYLTSVARAYPFSGVSSALGSTSCTTTRRSPSSSLTEKAAP